MISHAHLPFTLPCLRPCLPPVPNLWLLLLLFQIAWVFGFIMATRGATMMIVEIDSPTFPLITFIIRGKSWKIKVSRARWKNRENVLASANGIQANFLLFTKRFHMREMLDCSVYKYLRCLRDSITRCLSPSISHSSSMSPVLEC